MDNTSVPDDDSLYVFKVDGVEKSIFNIFWVAGPELLVVADHAAGDGEEFCLRLKSEDPKLIDIHGHPCLGWPSSCDTYSAALSPKRDDDGKIID